MPFAYVLMSYVETTSAM